MDDVVFAEQVDVVEDPQEYLSAGLEVQNLLVQVVGTLQIGHQSVETLLLIGRLLDLLVVMHLELQDHHDVQHHLELDDCV